VSSIRDAEFATFIAADAAALLHTAWLLCGDAHRAEELTQQALVSTYLAWPRARDSDPLAYARRTLANARIDSWRRRRREVLTNPETVPDGASPGPEDRVTEGAARGGGRRRARREPRDGEVHRVPGPGPAARGARRRARTTDSLAEAAMNQLMEDPGAAALRERALELAPAMSCQPDRVIHIGRRHRTRRAVGGVLAGLAGVVLVGAGVLELATPDAQVLGFAAPAQVQTAEDLIAVLAQPPSGGISIPPEVAVDVVRDSARFVGGTGGADAYAAVNTAGDLCLVLAIPDGEEWVGGSSCASPGSRQLTG